MVSDFDSLDRQAEGRGQRSRVMRLHLEVPPFKRREGGRRQLRNARELGLRQACTHAEVKQLEVVIIERHKFGDRNAKDVRGASQRVDLRCDLSDLPRPHGAHADVSKARELTARQTRLVSGPSEASWVEPAQNLATHARSPVRRAPITRSHCAAPTSVVVSMMFYIDILEGQRLAVAVH